VFVRLSARNVLKGKVKSIKHGAVNSEILIQLSEAPKNAPINDPKIMLRETMTALVDNRPTRARRAKLVEETNRLMSRFAATISCRGTFKAYNTKGIRSSDPPSPTSPDRIPVRKPETVDINNSRVVSNPLRLARMLEERIGITSVS